MKKSKAFLIFILLFFGFALITSTIYTFSNFVFDENPIGQIIFHVLVPAKGTGSEFVKGILIQCILMPLFASIFVTYVLYNKHSYFEFSFFDKYKFRPYLFIRKNIILICVIFTAISFLYFSKRMGLRQYIHDLNTSTTLYEDEYVDPRQIEFEFPEKKRNLIYIFLESVEIADYSFDEGGAFPDNYVPELYQLAEENITFNDNKGYNIMSNASWTASSMIAQTSGIALLIPIDGNSYMSETKFLKGAYSIGEILEKEGYTNELLIGSDASFGGRRDYFTQHGNYLIHDYLWAKQEGKIPEDYYVWWGYEDHKLFEFAKEELLELSSKDEPFNFTMLTVDSHHAAGYKCEYCKDDYDENLANVYACSSRHTYEFIEWIKQQDFYENTTIVIVGDHPSMDTDWAKLMPADYFRKAYYVFINPAEGLTPSSNRTFNTADFYPTTVASLGIKWNGNRLGLGTNLFSNEQTLVEKYGHDEFNYMAGEHSFYYDKYILYVD